MTEAIKLDEVWATRDHETVLKGITLAVARGEIVAVLGPSGSGKSTMLRVILGLLPPLRGRVLLGTDVVSADGRVLRPPEKRNLGMVFQDLALWPHLTVHGNLAFGLDARGSERAERDRRIDAMLERVGLRAKRDRHPGNLSGGERQRVAIARALVLNPAAVLLDEPLTNLDVLLKEQLLGLLRELLAERTVAALYVTHDAREAARLASRIAVMIDGRIVQSGTLAELRAAPANDFVARLLDEVGLF